MTKDAESNHKRIIINADDFGMSHEKNLAIDEMMRNGICTNASLVVNTPWTTEAVNMAFSGGYEARISLHINLTVGQALSYDIKKISLYCEDGNFVHRPIITKTIQILPFYVKEVRKEIETQILKFKEYGLQLNSIDSHNWVHLRLPVWLALKPLLTKYHISIVRPMWIGYKREEIASKKWSRYFRAIDPVLKKCKKCNIIQYTSNIEQFLLVEKELEKLELVEVFTHPDIIEGQIMDMSSSYTKQPRKKVVDGVALVSHYEKITIQKVLEEKER